ncbi:serine/threonine protein kinase [Archangium violaceum]|uniref:serine/threonine protein kinase n=1 Tax=Archangium violaceum TaxID=83451 RepID=UPI00194F0161|nr:serine/threonine-protein kinase [Archangium violaceum]QRO00720.1 serine/threonine protein kinase [Archangium violaceum]
MLHYLPQPGAMVGAYELVEPIGRGGSGLVYKAARGGRHFAVKVLNRAGLDGWARREITALAHLALPNVVRFIGYDWWPEAERGYPCLIMEYVPGLTLDKWVERDNPSTRQVVTLFLKVARALGEVFRSGVLHRDVKENNILIREEDGEPVLIDFGISAVEGAPPVTEPGKLPPGTPEYRSPEAVHFLRDVAAGGSFTYSHTDELWALGVTLYWLLTDILPFGNRMQPGLQERILVEAPRPPHLLNSRVPEAVSRLCLRMLEKKLEERFPTHDEVCTAVEALLLRAEEEASWDLPLVDPDSPHRVTTVEEPKEDRPKDEKERDVREWIVHEPRRGRPPREKPAEPLAQEEWPLVGELNGQAAQAVREASLGEVTPGEEQAAAAAPPPEAPAGHVAGETALPELVGAKVHATAEPAPSSTLGVRRWRGGAGGSGPAPLRDWLQRSSLASALVAVLVAVAFAVGLWRSPAPVWEATPILPATQVTPSPGTAAQGREAGSAVPLHEVAPPGNPAEADRSAAPVRVQSSASTPTARLRQEDSRLTPEKKPTTQKKSRTSRCTPTPQRVCTAAGICSVVLLGCTSAQVRPEAASLDCPAGWKESHTTFEIRGGGPDTTAVLQGHKGHAGEMPSTMKEGPFAVYVTRDEFGSSAWKLPVGTLLTGTLIAGENRYFGRFTQAQTPDKQTYPVCIQIYVPVVQAMPGGLPDCPVGVGQCPAPGSKPETLKVFNRMYIQGTNRFQ